VERIIKYSLKNRER